MKKIAHFSLLILLITITFSFSFVEQVDYKLSDYFLNHYPNGINIPGYSGAPGEYNCGDCHNCDATPAGKISRFLIKDSLGNLITNYIPNSTYSIEFTDTLLGNKGFQCTVLNDSNWRAGDLVAGANTQLSTLLNNKTNKVRQYINHTNPFNSTWKFQWKAPDNNMGNVTFYFSTGNYQNIYLSNYTLKGEKNTTGLLENKDAFSLNVYYLSSENSLFIRFRSPEYGMSTISIVDLSGKIVYRSKLGNVQLGIGQEDIRLPSHLESGYYTVQLFVNNSFATKKLFIP